MFYIQERVGQLLMPTSFPALFPRVGVGKNPGNEVELMLEILGIIHKVAIFLSIILIRKSWFIAQSGTIPLDTTTLAKQQIAQVLRLSA